MDQERQFACRHCNQTCICRSARMYMDYIMSLGGNPQAIQNIERLPEGIIENTGRNCHAHNGSCHHHYVTSYNFHNPPQQCTAGSSSASSTSDNATGHMHAMGHYAPWQHNGNAAAPDYLTGPPPPYNAIHARSSAANTLPVRCDSDNLSIEESYRAALESTLAKNQFDGNLYRLSEGEACYGDSTSTRNKTCLSTADIISNITCRLSGKDSMETAENKLLQDDRYSKLMKILRNQHEMINQLTVEKNYALMYCDMWRFRSDAAEKINQRLRQQLNVLSIEQVYEDK